MSIALRLNDELVHAAEAEGALLKRTAPKQIEFWAELGRQVAAQVGSRELLALMQGAARLQVEPVRVPSIDVDDLFAKVETRAVHDGDALIGGSGPRYAASQSHPGLIDRLDPDGCRTPGRFVDGQFHPEA